MQQLPLGMRWRESSVFATFLPGKNQIAIDQLRQIESAASVAVWLWGARGSGKSHLLQASCALYGDLGKTTAYFPLLRRTEFGVDALAGCEQLDLVCIDDVHAIAGDAQWERALFGLYNGLQERQGRLLVAAEQPARAVRWALPDLQSRLNSSLVLEVKPLGDDEQKDVLKLRARNRGLELPEETANFLLRHYPRDLRTQCDLLDTLDAASLAAQRRLTLPFIKQVIAQRR